MAKINWLSQFSVHVKLLDDQHKKIFALMNEAYDHAENIASVKNMDDFFNRLSAHAKEHFDTEEKYFKLFAYDDAAEHVAAHDRVRIQIEEARQKYHLNGPQTGIFATIEIFEDWLQNHIMALDKKYMNCFHEHGLI